MPNQYRILKKDSHRASRTMRMYTYALMHRRGVWHLERLSAPSSRHGTSPRIQPPQPPRLLFSPLPQNAYCLMRALSQSHRERSALSLSRNTWVISSSSRSLREAFFFSFVHNPSLNFLHREAARKLFRVARKIVKYSTFFQRQFKRS